MKAKLKFDKDAIVGFAVQHVEKFVFAAVVVCCAMIVYGAVQRDPYDKTPEDLKKKASDAQESVNSTNPDDGPELTAPPFSEIVNNILKPSVVDKYRYNTTWDKNIFPKLRLRGKPPLLAVEELRGSAGRAPFRCSLGQNAADGQIGKRWVVITGVVPIKRQTTEYEETFLNVREPRPKTDVPHYFYYLVERAEGDGPDGELVWKRLRRRRHAEMAQSLWGGDGERIIEEKYREPNGYLDFPLGPRVSLDRQDGQPVGSHAQQKVHSAWLKDLSVAHLPQIPFPRPEEPAEERGPSPEEPPLQEGVMPEDANASDLPDGNALPPSPPGTPARPGHRPGGAAKHIAHRPGVPGARKAEEKPEYWLFRFFDFTVEPGKSYRYRVQLVLENPNYRVRSRFLEPAVAAEQKRLIAEGKEASQVACLTTAYSKPTDVIHVPRDYEVLLASIKPPLRSWDETSVGMMIVQWVESCGKVAHHTQERVVRGSVLNYPNMKFPPEQESRPTRRVRGRNGDDADAPAGMAVGVMPGDLPGATPAAMLGGNDTIDVSYMTEAIVLDIAGGGRLRGKDARTSPGRVIMLDNNGSLVVREELADRPRVTARTNELPEQETTQPGPGPHRPKPKPAGGLRGLQVRPRP